MRKLPILLFHNHNAKIVGNLLRFLLRPPKKLPSGALVNANLLRVGCQRFWRIALRIKGNA
ncbi:hypothetical protein D3C86_2021360 [compost metagenome]